MSFTNKYLRGYKTSTKTTSLSPIYTVADDLKDFAPASINIGDNMYVPAAEGSLGQDYLGNRSVKEFYDGGETIYSRWHGGGQSDNDMGAFILQVNEPGIYDITCTFEVTWSFGAKSDDWCKSYSSVKCDDVKGETIYRTRSHRGYWRTETVSLTTGQLAKGEHTISLNIRLSASSGDNAGYNIRKVTFILICNDQSKINKTDIHVTREGKNYTLLTAPNWYIKS